MVSAAESLNMSRAMVTRYLSEMEKWSGARLLHRSTRKLSLTDAGENTLARCRKMLAVAAEMVSVGASQDDAARFITPELFAIFRAGRGGDRRCGIFTPPSAGQH